MYAVIYTKTAELIAMLFGADSCIPWNNVLDGGHGQTNLFATMSGDKIVMQPFINIL